MVARYRNPPPCAVHKLTRSHFDLQTVVSRVDGKPDDRSYTYAVNLARCNSFRLGDCTVQL